MTLCFHANGFPIVTEVTHTEPLGSNHQASTALARSQRLVNTRPLRDVTQDHSRTKRTQLKLGLGENPTTKLNSTLGSTVLNIFSDLGYTLDHSENSKIPKITSWVACLSEVLNQNDNGITTQQTINRVTGTVAYRNRSFETVNLINFRVEDPRFAPCCVPSNTVD